MKAKKNKKIKIGAEKESMLQFSVPCAVASLN